jgi:hypothetical protein
VVVETIVTKLSKLHEARKIEQRPESLQELIHRVRYAAEWNQEQAEKARQTARGFGRLSTVEEYTEQQREDARYAAGHEFGVATVRDDAARTLDSIADALVALVGEPTPL